MMPQAYRQVLPPQTLEAFPIILTLGCLFTKFQAIKLFLRLTLALEAVIEVENVTVLA